jgi:hypothetical protein
MGFIGFLRTNQTVTNSMEPRISLRFMETADSLPHSHEPETCPYPEPDQSSPCPQPTSWRYIFNIIFPFKPGSSKWFIVFRFPQQNPVSYTKHILAYIQNNETAKSTDRGPPSVPGRDSIELECPSLLYNTFGFHPALHRNIIFNLTRVETRKSGDMRL